MRKNGDGSVTYAVFHRQFLNFFHTPVGYLAITAFLWASAYFAFWHQDTFFATNLADLDPLTHYYPLVLLFFLPAVTMNSWSEEKRSGTEELLFTLPASDWSIVLGKFFACGVFYTAALIFSAGNISVLFYLGNPDIGVVASTYLGYWLLGIALIPAGMVASSLTRSAPVAYLLGIGITFAVVMPGQLETLAAPQSDIRSILHQLSIVEQLDPFFRGLLTLGGILFCAAVTLFLLQINLFILSRRHWGRGPRAVLCTLAGVGRALAMGGATLALALLADREEIWLSVDVTEQRLHQLSPPMVQLLEGLPSDQVVTVNAFVSPKVPGNSEPSRRSLLTLLRRVEAVAKGRIQVHVNTIDLYSDQAQQARSEFGITPVDVLDRSDSRVRRVPVYLAAVIQSQNKRLVIPFFAPGMSVEYELAAAIDAVTTARRRVVGVLETSAHFLGGNGRPAWKIVRSLQTRFDVISVSPDKPIDPSLDCLVVPMASSLKRDQLAHVIDFVRAGHATLLLEDSLPIVNMQLAPHARGGLMDDETADLRDLTRMLNVELDAFGVVYGEFDATHPRFEDLPPEIVFINRGGLGESFNEEHPITSGLQEMVFLYPGGIREIGLGHPTVIPLLTISIRSGTTRVADLLKGENGQFNPIPRRVPGTLGYMLAAYIHGPPNEQDFQPTRIPPATGEKSDSPDAKSRLGAARETNAPSKEQAKDAADVQVILIGDIDFLSDAFFEMTRTRSEMEEDIFFDNVAFVQNCIDFLSGDETLLELRKRRPSRRGLDRMTVGLTEQLAEARHALTAVRQQRSNRLLAAQKEINDKRTELEGRNDLSDAARAQMLATLERNEQKRLTRTLREINDETQKKVEGINDHVQAVIRDRQRWIKFWILFLPPLPLLVLGIYHWLREARRENIGASRDRLR